MPESEPQSVMRAKRETFRPKTNRSVSPSPTAATYNQRKALLSRKRGYELSKKHVRDSHTHCMITKSLKNFLHLAVCAKGATASWFKQFQIRDSWSNSERQRKVFPSPGATSFLARTLYKHLKIAIAKSGQFSMWHVDNHIENSKQNDIQFFVVGLGDRLSAQATVHASLPFQISRLYKISHCLLLLL